LVDSSLDGGRWVIAGSLGSYNGAWFKKVKKHRSSEIDLSTELAS